MIKFGVQELIVIYLGLPGLASGVGHTPVNPMPNLASKSTPRYIALSERCANVREAPTTCLLPCWMVTFFSFPSGWDYLILPSQLDISDYGVNLDAQLLT